MNFYNQIIDKKALKRIISWFVENYGPGRTSLLIEEFKHLGFHAATRAGLSLGFDDLRIPAGKYRLLNAAQKEVQGCENKYLSGKITSFERYQKLIDIWTTTSENLKDEVIKNFQKTPLNPLYMMAFSGARGNISQVRQLVGMRGLMSDSGGGIIDFPIRSNFREGLSVTEYVISCYGARKGLIDTALRTADSGYLTRRLVDVAHSIIITEIDCGSLESIRVQATEKNLLGRVLASTIRIPLQASYLPVPSLSSGIQEKHLFSRGTPHDSFLFVLHRNQDISSSLARELIQALNFQKKSHASFYPESSLENLTMVNLRSALTCAAKNLCQMCYGWNLAQGRFVSIGDAVGILAAQSIGEPGTQLTMRTFHTGGIFSTDVEDKIFSPQAGFVSFDKFPRGSKVRSVHGQTGFLSFEPVKLRIRIAEENLSLPQSFTPSLEDRKGLESDLKAKKTSGLESIVQLPAQSLIFVYPGKFVQKNELCAEISKLTDLGNWDESCLPLNSPEQKLSSTEEYRRKFNTDKNSVSLLAASKLKTESHFSTKKKKSVPKSNLLRSREAKLSHQIPKILPESAYKTVLSEIQGQVSLSWSFASSRVDSLLSSEYLSQKFDSRIRNSLENSLSLSPSEKSLDFAEAPLPEPELPKEVWVLAGSRFQKTPSYLGTFEDKFSNQASSVGYLGDLIFVKRGRGYHPTLLSNTNLRNSRISLGKIGEIPGLTMKFKKSSFEVRDIRGFGLLLKDQKRLNLVPKESTFSTNKITKENEEKELIFSGQSSSKSLKGIKNEGEGNPEKSTKVYKLGELIRRYNKDFHSQYSGQVIRKIGFRGGAQKTTTKNSGSSNFVFRGDSKIHSLVIRRVQPHLFSGTSGNTISLSTNLRPPGSFVEERDVLFHLLLPLQQSKTGDIVQGLPKIEQLFEGRGGQKEVFESPSLGSESQKQKFTLEAFRSLQQQLVTEIQSVYQSQGVEINDKHIEIIVRQMTSKVRILEKGNTSYFVDDIVDLHSVRSANLPETFYEPILLGITKVAFFTESFVSAASFQETKRVLMSSALQNRVDFLEGLKENVIVGRLIPAGTGY